MKKFSVLFVLFILPIVAYLFFASGINSFGKLPVITKNVDDIASFKSNSDKKVTLNNKITILAFAGNEIIKNQGLFFNFTEEIYNRNKNFTDFQVVVIVPNGTENQVNELISKLGKLTDMKGWNFVFGTKEEILNYHNKLKLKNKLKPDFGTNLFYIIDKKRNLRGRNGKEEYMEGYNTISPADLHNNMIDDVKIILAEYRFALKRNQNKRKI